MQAASTLSFGVAVACQPRVAECQPPPEKRARAAGKPKERWDISIRTMMATKALAPLSKSQLDAVRKTGQMPSCTEVPDLKRAYSTIYDWTLDELGCKSITDARPTRQAVTTTTKRWAAVFAQHGHVMDAPPHEPGYKNVGTRMKVLKEVRESLLQGFPSANGHFYYNNVKEAVARDPKISDWVNELGFERPESVWKLLKQLWSDLYLGDLHMKKPRNHAQTAVWIHMFELQTVSSCQNHTAILACSCPVASKVSSSSCLFKGACPCAALRSRDCWRAASDMARVPSQVQQEQGPHCAGPQMGPLYYGWGRQGIPHRLGHTLLLGPRVVRYSSILRCLDQGWHTAHQEGRPSDQSPWPRHQAAGEQDL